MHHRYIRTYTAGIAELIAGKTIRLEIVLVFVRLDLEDRFRFALHQDRLDVVFTVHKAEKFFFVVLYFVLIIKKSDRLAI
jgi:hypothetical protein